MLRILALVAILVALAVFVTGFSSQRERADFVFVNRGDVFTLDPQRMSWLNDMQIAYCLYEGVVRWNTVDFSLEAAAAESYDISEDKKTIVFSSKSIMLTSDQIIAYELQKFDKLYCEFADLRINIDNSDIKIHYLFKIIQFFIGLMPIDAYSKL